MKGLSGRGILVTGAASGIGEATVRRLLDEGASVIGIDLAPEVPPALSELTYFRGDVLDAATIQLGSR